MATPKIVLFHPTTRDLVTSSSEKSIMTRIDKGYLVIGKVNGWNASVTPIPNPNEYWGEDTLLSKIAEKIK
jgi:hypothetical protein